MTPEQIAKAHALRRKGFSADGIARHLGVSDVDVARALGEPHLLARIARSAGKVDSRKGGVAAQ